MTWPSVYLELAVIDTLKQPSASVNPDNHASCNVTKTGVLFNLIVLEPKRLFKALNDVIAYFKLFPLQTKKALSFEK